MSPRKNSPPASQATNRHLQPVTPGSCRLILAGEGLDELSAFRHDTEHPEDIVVGDNRSRFDVDHRIQALRGLHRGRPLWGALLAGSGLCGTIGGLRGMRVLCGSLSSGRLAPGEAVGGRDASAARGSARVGRAVPP
jgi:hypothetical protein